MQEYYRIIVTPYHYDIWNIFIKDKAIFDSLLQANSVKDAIKILGVDIWEQLVDTWENPNHPYILLGEIKLMQYDY